jgi:hypothetical protein
MLFIFREKKVVLDLFTSTPWVPGTTQPAQAARFIPQWWRDLPKNDNELRPLPNMRGCAGFLDYFKSSLIVPMWSDLAVSVAPTGGTEVAYELAHPRHAVSVHPSQQRGSFLPDEEFQHIKLESPWYAKSKDDVQWVLTQPLWAFKDPLQVIIPPGILGFKYLSATNVNFFVKRNVGAPKQFRIDAGQPLIALTPMSERRFEVRTHLLSEQELQSNFPDRHTFFQKDYIKRRAAYAAEKRCPFSVAQKTNKDTD